MTIPSQLGKVMAMGDGFDIQGAVPDGMMEELSSGTSVLVFGPPYAWTQEFALDLLAAGHHEDGLLLVTTRDRASQLIERLENRVPNLDRGRIGVVDCSGTSEQEAIRDIATQKVSSPGDLTGISIGTSKILQRFHERDIDTVRHGLVTVSTLLQYLDLETVFQFLHVYTRRIDDTGGLGVFTLNESIHDPKIVATVTGECDGVFELRERDDGVREVRARGFSGAGRGWYELE